MTENIEQDGKKAGLKGEYFVYDVLFLIDVKT